MPTDRSREAAEPVTAGREPGGTEALGSRVRDRLAALEQDRNVRYADALRRPEGAERNQALIELAESEAPVDPKFAREAVSFVSGDELDDAHLRVANALEPAHPDEAILQVSRMSDVAARDRAFASLADRMVAQHPRQAIDALSHMTTADDTAFALLAEAIAGEAKRVAPEVTWHAKAAVRAMYRVRDPSTKNMTAAIVGETLADCSPREARAALAHIRHDVDLENEARWRIARKMAAVDEREAQKVVRGIPVSNRFDRMVQGNLAEQVAAIAEAARQRRTTDNR